MKVTHWAILPVLFLAGCGSGSTTADSPTSSPATSSDSRPTPTNDYIAQQFKIQMDSLAKDSATYRADVERGNDANAIQDAVTLGNEVAFSPKILGDEQNYGKATTRLPDVMAAAKTYGDALDAVSSGTAGQLKTAEAAVPSAADGFRTALQGFAADFGGQVPEV